MCKTERESHYFRVLAGYYISVFFSNVNKNINCSQLGEDFGWIEIILAKNNFHV